MNYYAPKEQQIEGLKFISKCISMREFSRATARLVEDKFLTRAKRYRLIKKMRRIKNISWEEYKKNYEVKPSIKPEYKGLW